MKETYKCQKCGIFITDDEGITCQDGSWVCDYDSCRSLDAENEAHMRSEPDRQGEVNRHGSTLD